MSSSNIKHESGESPTSDSDASLSDIELNQQIRPAGTGAEIPLVSKVEFYTSAKSHCGYCGSDGRHTYDMAATQLTARDYQELLDKNWRRSGHYCYHPINQDYCCPNYSISCDTINFILSRSQRRCIQNLNSFLKTGTMRGDHKSGIKYGSQDESGQKVKIMLERLISLDRYEKLKSSKKARDRRFVATCERKVKLCNISIDKAIEQVVQKNVDRTFRNPCNLEDCLFPKKTSEGDCEKIEPKHRLVIKLHPSDSNESLSMQDEKLRLIRKYQLNIHNEQENHWTMKRYSRFLVISPLLYEKMEGFSYPNTPDDIDEAESKLIYNENDEDAKYLLVKPPPLPTHYGTYHCLYYLDDRLIAVGVLDALPKCLTTVYLFYDTDYKHLNLGIYSALVEISMVRRISNAYIGPKEMNKFRYYYLGFYVHVCKKMSYKVTFRPSYLLCNETHRYVKTEDCLRKLKDRKYARFSDEPFEHPDRPLTYSDLLAIELYVPDLNCTSIAEYIRWLRYNIGMTAASIAVDKVFAVYYLLVGRSLARRIQLRMDILHKSLTQSSKRN